MYSIHNKQLQNITNNSPLRTLRSRVINKPKIQITTTVTAISNISQTSTTSEAIIESFDNLSLQINNLATADYNQTNVESNLLSTISNEDEESNDNDREDENVNNNEEEDEEDYENESEEEQDDDDDDDGGQYYNVHDLTTKQTTEQDVIDDITTDTNIKIPLKIYSSQKLKRNSTEYGKKLYFDCYVYLVASETISKTIWKCERQDINCKARIHTISNFENDASVKIEHNHDPPENEAELKLRHTIRNAAKTSTEKPRTIIRDALKVKRARSIHF
jgi:hypothetical protein